MNALDELEEIKELVNTDKKFKYKSIVNFNCDSIEKSLKALEIIKQKDVDVKLLKLSTNLLDYYTMVKSKTGENTELTEEEFDNLKEVLE